MAKDCPQTVDAARVIAHEEETISEEECWVHVQVLTAAEECKQNAVSNTGWPNLQGQCSCGRTTFQSSSRQWLTNLISMHRNVT